MKRIFKTFAASCLIATAVVASAAAASYDHCADSLKNMGLFQGTGSGYELDRAPTRAEAGTMLVRLLGKEDEAKKLDYTAPFTDVLDWQKPYVQYLYENGLTTGATATTFDPESKCSAQMYSAFSLRALGYNEKEGDYTYTGAIDKAYEIGLADYANCDETNFLRDHVAAMSYTALNCNPKGETASTLLDQLVKEGAVSASTAKTAQDQFAAYDSYTAAKLVFAKQTKVEMNADINAKISANGKNVITLAMPLNIKTDMNTTNMDQSKMAMTGTMKMTMDPSLVGQGEESSYNGAIEYYYTNGVFYMNMAGEKVKMPLSFEDALEGVVSFDSDITEVEPICIFKSITKSGDTITAKYSSEMLTGMIDSVLGDMGVTDVEMKFNQFDITETIKNDAYSGMTAVFDMEIKDATDSLGMNMDMSMKIVGTGNNVTITFPSDLSSYPSI